MPEKKKRINKLKAVFFVLLAGIIIFEIVVYIIEEKNLYMPRKEVILIPQSIKIKYEGVYFKTEDGESLNGWFIPAGNAKITVLYCGGRSGNMSDDLDNVKFFREMGFNLFVFDYRGFGNSSGKPSEQGLYKDARAAYDFLVTRKDIDRRKIVGYGKSLGVPVVADLCLHRKLCALILEGSFPSLKAHVQGIGGPLPLQWFVSEKFDAISRLKKVTIPKLFVHGMDDQIINFAEGRLLFNEAAPPKEFIPFDGDHDNNLFATSDAYKDKINEFLLHYRIL
jgi:fermentation-respiration switch protein FrsA (DUF1100 family)